MIFAGICYDKITSSNNRLECRELGFNDPRENYTGITTISFELANIQQSNGLQITYPNGGETLSGEVTILWTLEVIHENTAYDVYYSPDNEVHWIQLAFSNFEPSFEWDTLLFETYGTDFLIKVVASNKAWDDKVDISDDTFTIDNRTGVNGLILEDLYLPFIGLLFIIMSSGLVYLIYNKRFKQGTFVDFFESKKVEFLKSIREKVVIGLDNIKFEFIEESQDLPYLEAPTTVTSIVEYFPTDFRNELRIEIKGRTVLTLIEIAYQDPSETNPVKLAKSLNIPVSTLSKEIKKLIELQYVESFISSQVIQDGRFRNFKITSKGFSFLSILNNALRMTINRLKEKQNEFNEFLIN
jgi:DNA-binding MarR family transcriptional regulator